MHSMSYTRFAQKNGAAVGITLSLNDVKRSDRPLYSNEFDESGTENSVKFSKFKMLSEG